MATATKARIATVKGVFLAPGVSRNGRLYTSELIGKITDRVKQRLGQEGAPGVSMLPSHESQDVLSTLGKVTDCWQDNDGKGWFSADVPNTSAGKDLVNLVENGYVHDVSINGNWIGPTRWEVLEDGTEAETGDDYDMHRFDFCPMGGVPGARIDQIVREHAPPGSLADVTENAAVVVEDVEDGVLEADKKPYGDVRYADPGYQSDKVKRYPIDSAAHARAAWSYVNQQKNASKYSAADLAKVKGRIRAALRRFGVEVKDEAAGGGVTEGGSPAAVSERVAMEPYPGAVTLDPDGDGDVDGWACPTCGAVRSNSDSTTNPDGDELDLQSASSTTKEAAPVTDTPAAQAATTEQASGLPTTKEELDALIAEAAAKAVAEANKPKLPQTQEELDAVIAEAQREAVAKAGKGFPERKGLVVNTQETVAKKPWEMTSEEYKAFERESANAMLPGVPATAVMVEG